MAPAVGDYESHHFLFADIWSGKGWKRFNRLPNAPGATSGEFHGVACADATHCMAVGDDPLVPGGPVADFWNGRSWSWTKPRPRGCWCC